MKIETYIIKGILFLGIILQLTSCKKTNWDENFREKEKSPFGTYIVYNEANKLFKGQEIVFLKENFYDYIYDSKEVNKDKLFNYICIKSSTNKLTKSGVNSLLSLVYKGNNAFLALNYFSDELREKLDFTTNNLDKDVFTVENLKKLKGKFYLENTHFNNQPFKFDRNIRRNYVVTYNEKTTVVLGKTEIGGEKLPNFIKIYYGKGTVYLHTNPIVFTNYFLLKGTENYVENVFSYLPENTVYWDPQIKKSKYANESDKDNDSIFNFFLQHKTLTWFLFVSSAGLLLFMLFNARRKQRAIPIIKPLENTTVAFTQTISSLYLKEQDHKNLADKKIAFFLEKVRTKYLLDTSILNKDFIEHLAAKSGNKIENTNYLINTIITLHKRPECSQEELIVLHKMIENFFNK
ncbi:hypothetical protein [Polaribacter glomeratus]|uniref:DUF4350 domain-containing protein n=1 Tax=Polaribacter glomeratus TaxID=102 RepID=A0A2S7WW82_9FLAO|nr:hypothetical protein [Polaribacter glomeratus]PQJ81736.1 hypothetical protein BTO16_03755 [Polaribacter glomeratus]TXD66339.1 hypothetical protein ESX12_06020 [Polaribacter glomeratus]